MHGSLKNFRYGCDTRGSHVAKSDKGNWGIKIQYKGNAGNVEYWYETEAERERNFAMYCRGNNQFAVKSIKRKKRK
jgi:hypothetical protein